MQLQLPRRVLELRTPKVMGILNVTPDSFSDGGQYWLRDKALERARAMIAEGAHILDIGGESTRPGAAPVSVDEELDRVIPVIEALARESDVVLSVDTFKPQVMTAAVAAGAEIINDIYALRQPGALAAAAATNAAVCLMHMQGEPQSMQHEPVYRDVVTEVNAFLAERADAADSAGIDRSRILIDPGFGFGKTVAHNYQLLQDLPTMRVLKLPILVGLSRKSMLGAVTGRPVTERMAASVAGAVLALSQGAHIIRVHDVAQTVDAVAVVAATFQGV